MKYSLDGRVVPTVNGFKEYDNKGNGGGNPNHDPKNGQFTTGPGGRAGLKKKVDAEKETRQLRRSLEDSMERFSQSPGMKVLKERDETGGVEDGSSGKKTRKDGDYGEYKTKEAWVKALEDGERSLEYRVKGKEAEAVGMVEDMVYDRGYDAPRSVSRALDALHEARASKKDVDALTDYFSDDEELADRFKKLSKSLKSVK